MQAAEIQKLIRQVGLAPTKARNILALSQVCTMRGVWACKLPSWHVSSPRNRGRAIRCLSLHASADIYDLHIVQMLLELHGGVVPATFEELEQLPGVGHKTASVIMAEAHGCASARPCTRPLTELCLSRLMPALLLN